ncbi:MAG: hypothetical protein ACO1OF_06230 [Adhaeribacter sp.]
MIELPNWYQYNIKSLSILGGDIGLCDEIKVWDYDFFVHKRTGDVYFNSNLIKTLQGKCW